MANQTLTPNLFSGSSFIVTKEQMRVVTIARLTTLRPGSCKEVGLEDPGSVICGDTAPQANTTFSVTHLYRSKSGLIHGIHVSHTCQNEQTVDRAKKVQLTEVDATINACAGAARPSCGCGPDGSPHCPYTASASAATSLHQRSNNAPKSAIRSRAP